MRIISVIIHLLYGMFFLLSAETISISGTVKSIGNTTVAGASLKLSNQPYFSISESDGTYLITGTRQAVRGTKPANAGRNRFYLTGTDLVLTLTKRSAVIVEVFDAKGVLVHSPANEFLPRGETRLNIRTASSVAGLRFLRVTVDGRHILMQSMIPGFSAGTPGVRQSARMRPSGTVPSDAAIDSLTVSAPGFYPIVLPVYTYQELIDFSLDPATGTGQVATGYFYVNIASGNFPYIVGRVYESRPVTAFHDTIASAGSCHLRTYRSVECDTTCPSNTFCTGSTCEPYPEFVSVGMITVYGFKRIDGRNYTYLAPSDAYSPNYESPFNIFASPPCGEGDTLTLHACGSPASPPFDLTCAAVGPLVVTNYTDTVGKGSPLELTWVPPERRGTTKLSITVEIATHSLNIAELHCDCEDNGSFVIPADLLDRMRSFDKLGYTHLHMSRSSESDPTFHGIRLSSSSFFTASLYIQGVSLN